MTKEQIKKAEEWLNERQQIMEDFQRNEDLMYFKGAMQMLVNLGFDYRRVDGKIKIIK